VDFCLSEVRGSFNVVDGDEVVGELVVALDGSGNFALEEFIDAVLSFTRHLSVLFRQNL